MKRSRSCIWTVLWLISVTHGMVPLTNKISDEPETSPSEPVTSPTEPVTLSTIMMTPTIMMSPTNVTVPVVLSSRVILTSPVVTSTVNLTPSLSVSVLSPADEALTVKVMLPVIVSSTERVSPQVNATSPQKVESSIFATSPTLLSPAPIPLMKYKPPEKSAESCLYKFPETRHLNTMLGNMMNKLTTVFRGMQELLRKKRKSGPGGLDPEVLRYHMVHNRSAAYFDHIYSNMTTAYSLFFNTTRLRVEQVALTGAGVGDGGGGENQRDQEQTLDPCGHQEDLRDAWWEIIDTSQELLWRAGEQYMGVVMECVRAVGGVRARAQARAERLLRLELAGGRGEMLGLLCNIYQLCYDELY